MTPYYAALLLSFSVAVSCNAVQPTATALNPAPIMARAAMPMPTNPPELTGSEDFPNQICGYDRGFSERQLYCDEDTYCTFNSAAKLAYCRSSSGPDDATTGCLAKTEASKEDPGILLCTGVGSTECATFTFFDHRYTIYGCGSIPKETIELQYTWTATGLGPDPTITSSSTASRTPSRTFNAAARATMGVFGEVQNIGNGFLVMAANIALAALV